MEAAATPGGAAGLSTLESIATLGVLPEDILMRAPTASFDREALDCARVVPSLSRLLPAVGGGDRAGELAP